MPIAAIITQPAVNAIRAAYRPILLRVTATATNGAISPPVVFCDVYINSVFYKTVSKTQHTKVNPLNNSEWEFDIRDVLQEYLQKFIANNGGSVITEANPVVAAVYCKFRSSGINLSGFVMAEGTAPIQGTDDEGPVPGTGTQSNIFFVVNATLQHEDNDDLATHLNVFKNRTWQALAYPLTHRPDHYYLCRDDSDFFPILTSLLPAKIKLHYRLKDSATWLNSTVVMACTPVGIIGAPVLPDATVGVAYNYVINLSGSAPFALSAVVKPAWMTVAVVGSTIEFTGLPLVQGIGHMVSFTVSNCAGAHSTNFAQDIDIDPATGCVPVSFVGGVQPAFPFAITGTPYVFDIALAGDPPFAIATPPAMPPWMTININGDIVEFRGTPSLLNYHELENILLTVSNCGGLNELNIYTVLRVATAGRNVTILNETGAPLTLSNNYGSFTFGAAGSFPMQNGTFTIQTMTGAHDVVALHFNLTGVIQTEVAQVQGNVINLTDLNNTDIIRFMA